MKTFTQFLPGTHTQHIARQKITTPSAAPTAQPSSTSYHAFQRRAHDGALSWGEQITFFQTLIRKAS